MLLPVLQACEEAISKLKTQGSGSITTQSVWSITSQLLYPLIQGCETKEPKLAKVFRIPGENLCKLIKNTFIFAYRYA